MPRKKPVKDPQDEIDATCKLLCDEARNHMKVRNYIKALAVYNKLLAASMAKARDILGTDRDNEFLQSFVRVGLNTTDDDDAPYKSVYTQQKPDLAKQASETKTDTTSPRKSRTSLTLEVTKKKKKQKEYFDEVYTDKDRAAAVSLGSYDIKQSMIMKRRQDRTEALHLPDDSDPGALFELGLREYKSGNTETAILFISKALELNPSDQNALVARSKCYLLLGDPAKALEDAEAALNADKTNIRAIYQKAEALYFLGQFEHSLMFFHRGLRLRPELNSFRLGVQKSQEAIEKTIGGFPKKTTKTTAKDTTATGSSRQPPTPASAVRPATNVVPVPVVRGPSAKVPTKAALALAEKREAKKLLGELCVDKEYLENLLKHPDLKRADTGAENISVLAKDAVQFLNTRQEFWRQQRPCTAMPNQKKVMIDTPLLK